MLPSKAGGPKGSGQSTRETTPIARGTWRFRRELEQLPSSANGKPSPSFPYVNVVELKQPDVKRSTWVAVFAGDVDTVIGTKMSGKYQGERFTYYNKSPNIYSDTNGNGRLDRADRFLGYLDLGAQTAAAVKRINAFDTFTIGSGTWEAFSNNTMALFNQDRSLSTGPINIPPGLF